MDNTSEIKNKFIKYVDEIITKKRVSHSYLIEVNNYDEDMKYINLFIKMILLEKKYDEILSSDDKIIKLVDEENYPDIYVISSDISIIKKSQIIDLQKEFNNKSFFNNKKIYIIKESEKLNSSSANTILKFLEEPEDDIIAFLLTDDRYHVIDTIVSRCQILSLKENNNNYDINDDLLDLLNFIFNSDEFYINYNEYIKDKFSDKNTFKDYLNEIEIILVNYLSDKNTNKEITKFLDKIDNNEIVEKIAIMEEEIPKLEFNVNYKLWLDSLFSKFKGGY